MTIPVETEVESIIRNVLTTRRADGSWEGSGDFILSCREILAWTRSKKPKPWRDLRLEHVRRVLHAIPVEAPAQEVIDQIVAAGEASRQRPLERFTFLVALPFVRATMPPPEDFITPTADYRAAIGIRKPAPGVFPVGKLDFKMLGPEQRLPPGFTARNEVERQFAQAASANQLTWFEATGFCRDAVEAWNKDVGPAFANLRGVIEYIVGRYRWGWSSPPQPRAKLRAPPVVFLAGAPEGEPLRFRNQYDEYRTWPWAEKMMTALAYAFESHTWWREPLIGDCFRLYAAAVDKRDLPDALVAFWTVAERLTLAAAAGGNTDHVLKRLTWHLQRVGLVGGAKLAATMRELASLRNEVVHSASERVTDEDVNILKFVVELAIAWLIEHSGTLNSEQRLEEFYRLRLRSDSEVGDAAVVADFIETGRRRGTL